MKTIIWRQTTLGWIGIVLALVGLILVFSRELLALIDLWSKKEEYSHGFLIPAISIFMLWQKSESLREQQLKYSWWGVVIICLGFVLLLMGRLGAVYDLGQYGFIVALFGLAVTLVGWKGVKLIWAPLFILVFMVPLPQFIYNDLSLQLQLVSSELGVAFIRLFDISVYLEGNVIDLGSYKLQVVEACSGLRYLFPLMSLAFIAAYFYKAKFWKRAVIFLSSIPITILMNSLRIGVIGVLVEYWGIEQAEGFLHDFEGWVIFMACLAILLLEMWALERFAGSGNKLSDVFEIDFPNPPEPESEFHHLKFPTVIIPVIAFTITTWVLSEEMERREPVPIDRAEFAQFPKELGDWAGRMDQLETIYLDNLKLDDYIVADYYQADQKHVNFYAAYYSSQVSGSSVHSPRSCLPGGGWLMDDLQEVRLGSVQFNGKPLTVNRVIIKKGEYTQLVYYWFQQRGRDITDEMLVRWYILWDSIVDRRTDGALVRLTTLVRPGEDLTIADQRLEEFARDVAPYLSDYIPD